MSHCFVGGGGGVVVGVGVVVFGFGINCARHPSGFFRKESISHSFVGGGAVVLDGGGFGVGLNSTKSALQGLDLVTKEEVSQYGIVPCSKLVSCSSCSKTPEHPMFNEHSQSGSSIIQPEFLSG